MSEPLTPSELRRHPVSQLLDHAAMGELPRESELDALKLPLTTRRRISDAATVTVGIKAGGDNAVARQHARDQADRIVSELSTEHRNPEYLKPADETPDDPAGLANMVSRGW